MKKILLIIALLISGLGVNAQSGSVNYMKYNAMYTTYDLQSNSFIANRMYQLKDGSVAVTATMSTEEFDESFPDRGTGYNFVKGGNMDSWGDVPSSRIEEVRTGWPSIAPYGAEGEILVSHGHEKGLCYYIREKAGEGEWDGPHAIPNPTMAEFTDLAEDLQLSWPRIATTGENNDVVHIFAAGQGDVNLAHFYVRSTDLENWEVKYAPVQEQGLHLFKIGEGYSSYEADDYAVSTNGDRIAVVYCSGWATNVYCYESSDAGLTWESRLVWESPIHGLDWETDEESLISTCYGPVHAAVAIGQDGVSHVALSVGLFSHATLENSYGIYNGLYTDGIAYWNDTITRWEGVPSPIRSSQDDDPKHALRLWWEVGGELEMDATNFCAWMPPHAENGWSEFESSKQYTGTVAGSGQAGDYATKFGLSAYPALAVDPAGNLAVAWSSPDLNRELYAGLYYMRTIFAKYKPAEVPYWSQVDNHGTSLYQVSSHLGDEATNITGVSVSVNENEFWFSCLSDDTPGFHSGNNTSQPNISNGIIKVFKYTPEKYNELVHIDVSAEPYNAGIVYGAGVYIENEIVTLKAIPSMGCMFVNWTENGEIISTDAEYTFVATENRNLVANFDGELQYIVTSNSPAECKVTGIFNKKETSVTIPSTVLLDGTEYTVASIGDNAFSSCVSLTSIELPSGVTSIESNAFSSCVSLTSIELPSGVTSIGSRSFRYCSRLTSIFCYAEDVPVAVDNTFEFCPADMIIYVPANSVDAYKLTSPWNRYTIKAIPTHCEVTVAVSPDKAGVVTGAGSYEINGNVTVTATANAGYTFVNWTENNKVVSEDAEYTFTITKDRILVANFIQTSVTYNVTTTVNPEKVGVVIGSGLYFKGDNVTLTAIPIKNGYEFVNWTENGVVVSEDAQYSFVVTSDRNLVANFVLLDYYVSVAVSSAEAGEVTGDGNYNHGDTVALIATANEGYAFVNWTEDGEVVSENAQYSFVIIKDRELTANFVETEGVEEHETSFNIYPNPVSDKLYIETEVEIEEVSIFDIYGRRQELSAVSCQPSAIDVSNLNSGVYFVKVVTENGETVKRFVKK